MSITEYHHCHCLPSPAESVVITHTNTHNNNPHITRTHRFNGAVDHVTPKRASQMWKTNFAVVHERNQTTENDEGSNTSSVSVMNAARLLAD